MLGFRVSAYIHSYEEEEGGWVGLYPVVRGVVMSICRVGGASTNKTPFLPTTILIFPLSRWSPFWRIPLVFKPAIMCVGNWILPASYHHPHPAPPLLLPLTFLLTRNNLLELPKHLAWRANPKGAPYVQNLRDPTPGLLLLLVAVVLLVPRHSSRLPL